MREVHIGEKLTGRDMSGLDLANSYFRDCVLDDVRAVGTNLDGATIYHCSARRMDLTDGSIENLFPKETDFEGATFPVNSPPDGVEIIGEMIRVWAVAQPTANREAALSIKAYFSREPYHAYLWADSTADCYARVGRTRTIAIAEGCFGRYPRIIGLLRRIIGAL